MASFLKGAMQALSSNAKTRRFYDTLDYADLPENWAFDREVRDLARAAYREAGTDSPFFRAYFKGSQIVDSQGRPVVMYHGSKRGDLKYISPLASRYGVSFVAEDPGTALSYLLRPSRSLRDFDPAYREFYDAQERALRAGKPLRIGITDPSTGKPLEVYSGGDVGQTMKALSDTLNDLDFAYNLELLNSAYSPGRRHVPVPQSLLEQVASGGSRQAYNDFLALNAGTLRDLAGNPVDRAFSGSLGRIYPVYVKAKAPLVVSGRPGLHDWVSIGRMDVDPSSLSRQELERLAASSWNGRRITPADLYPELHLNSRFLPDGTPNTVPPTDVLASRIRYDDAGHDALWAKDISDGGALSEELPIVTNTAAVPRSTQLKSVWNEGTFDPNQQSLMRAGIPVAAGGALAAAMGAPSSASASGAGWLPPSAGAEMKGMEPGWLDPVGALVDFATAGGGTLSRAGQALAGLTQDWLAERIPDIPEVPEQFYAEAQ